MEIRTRIKGGGRLTAQLKKWGSRAIPATKSALYTEAELIMTKSKELCPVDTGALRSTGVVEQPTVSGTNVKVVMGYGGPAKQNDAAVQGEAPEEVGYAIYAHEDLSAYHKVGQAKYLEQPIREWQSGGAKRLQRRIKRKMKLR